MNEFCYKQRRKNHSNQFPPIQWAVEGREAISIYRSWESRQLNLVNVINIINWKALLLNLIVLICKPSWWDPIVIGLPGAIVLARKVQKELQPCWQFGSPCFTSLVHLWADVGGIGRREGGGDLAVETTTLPQPATTAVRREIRLWKWLEKRRPNILPAWLAINVLVNMVYEVRSSAYLCMYWVSLPPSLSLTPTIPKPPSYLTDSSLLITLDPENSVEKQLSNFSPGSIIIFIDKTLPSSGWSEHNCAITPFSVES